MKAQADLTDEGRRESVVAAIKRLMNDIQDGEIDSIVITVDLVGSEEPLKGLETLAKNIEGAQSRREALPD